MHYMTAGIGALWNMVRNEVQITFYSESGGGHKGSDILNTFSP
jgi:hypothetical protein